MSEDKRRKNGKHENGNGTYKEQHGISYPESPDWDGDLKLDKDFVMMLERLRESGRQSA